MIEKIRTNTNFKKTKKEKEKSAGKKGKIESSIILF